MSSTIEHPGTGLTADEVGIPRTADERPKGYARDYVPRAGSERERFMDAAQAEIEAQASPRTTRFIAYRTAGRLGVGHDQLDNIEEAVLMLRRTGRVSMGAVRDGRSAWHQLWVTSAAEAAHGLLGEIQDLHHDRQDGQPWRAVLLLEAAGLMESLAATADLYGVPMVSGSGSVPLSVTERLGFQAAQLFRKTGTRTVVMSIGDFDLMGLRNIFVPAARDIERFAADYDAPGAVVVERIAATPEQIAAHLPRNLLQPAPPVPWWPADFSLPAAEALEDVLPGYVAAELDRYLPDAEYRAEVTAAEAALRLDAGRLLVDLLS